MEVSVGCHCGGMHISEVGIGIRSCVIFICDVGMWLSCDGEYTLMLELMTQVLEQVPQLKVWALYVLEV